MKEMIIVPNLGAARWIELPEVIVISAGWLQANFGPHTADVPNTHNHQETPDDVAR